MKTKSLAFDLFRYQILPKDRIFQPNLFEDITSLDQLLEQKNRIFSDALLAVKQFKTHRSMIRHKLIKHDKDSFLYKFAANRSITRETEEFTEEEISTWPSFLIFIWNAPNQQIIAVQERWNAFKDTEVVAKAIAESVSSSMSHHNLRAHVETIFLEKAFWALVNENKGKIKDIKFEIITPNLSNISEILSDELKEFARSTNTAQTNIDLIADPDSSILVNDNDPRMKGLVEYSSQGGGNISLKLRGISKRVHTKKSKKRIDIEEVEITGDDDSSLIEILKDLIQ